MNYLKRVLIFIPLVVIDNLIADYFEISATYMIAVSCLWILITIDQKTE